MNHYHIRWDNSNLDWEAFPTKDEAVVEAERLKLLNENYTIVERNGNCERCLRVSPNSELLER
jgi:hypothetical protein